MDPLTKLADDLAKRQRRISRQLRVTIWMWAALAVLTLAVVLLTIALVVVISTSRKEPTNVNKNRIDVRTDGGETAKPWLTTGEFCQLEGVHPDTVYARIKAGKLRAEKQENGRYLIRNPNSAEVLP